MTPRRRPASRTTYASVSHPTPEIALAARVKRAGEQCLGDQRELSLLNAQPNQEQPYERLLGDALAGEGALFTSAETVEAAWTVVDPILENHPRAFTGQRVAEEPFVGLLLVRLRVEQGQFALVAEELLAGPLNPGCQRDLRVGCESEAEVVRKTGLRSRVIEQALRWRLQFDQHLRCCLGQTLPRPQVPRNARPAPGVDIQPHCAEGLHVRILRYARLVVVADELAPDHVVGTERTHRLEHVELLALHCPETLVGRRLHGQ